MSQEDPYDISTYTDKDLFNILDINESATDRELEARIIYQITKYKNITNTGGKMLHNFFKNIYDHFFDSDTDADIDENDADSYADEKTIKEGFTSASNVTDKPTATPTGTSTIITTVATPPTDPKNALDYVSNLSYTQGKLNPILKETIKRIVSIDSKYRDISTYPSASNYTLNLADTLSDVVSLKLYSVQIPYSWYTIDSNFGSNFFYFKGTSPGINNGDHDYQISIETGIYTAPQITDVVNKSIQAFKSTVNDVSFGTTELYYNTTNLKSSITLDIKKFYNESYYELYFPDWSDPSQTTTHKKSIAGFLGYNKNQYNPTIAYSYPFSTTDTSTTTYTIDNSNNTFNIYLYNGTYSPDTIKTGYIANANIAISNANQVLKIPITISTGTHDISTIIQNTNAQLHANRYLQDSSMSILPISNMTSTNQTDELNLNDAVSTNIQQSYNLRIKLNRTTTNMNIENAKIAVDFDTGNLWTGPTSPFKFLTNKYTSTYYAKSNPTVIISPNICELSNILSETMSPQTTFYVDNNPKIKLKNTLSGYSGGYSDYIINIPNATDVNPNPNTQSRKKPYYIYDSINIPKISYIQALTTAIQNPVYVESDPMPGPNNTSDISLNANDNFNIRLIPTSDISGINGIDFSFNHVYTNADYHIDLSNSILSDLFGFPTVTKCNELIIYSYSIYNNLNQSFDSKPVIITASNNYITFTPSDGLSITISIPIPTYTIPITTYTLTNIITAIKTAINYAITNSVITNIGMTFDFSYNNFDLHKYKTTDSIKINRINLSITKSSIYTIDLSNFILCTEYDFYPTIITRTDNPYIQCNIPIDIDQYTLINISDEIKIQSINSRTSVSRTSVPSTSLSTNLNQNQYYQTGDTESENLLLIIKKTFSIFTHESDKTYLIGNQNTQLNPAFKFTFDSTNISNDRYAVKLEFNIQTKIDQSHYSVSFDDDVSNYDSISWNTPSNTWANYLHISDNYAVSHELSLSTLILMNFIQNQITISDQNNWFLLKPIQDGSGGVYTPIQNDSTILPQYFQTQNMPYYYNDLLYKITPTVPHTYQTVEDLMYDIQTALQTQHDGIAKNSTVLQQFGGKLSIDSSNSIRGEYTTTQIRLFVDKIFTSTDYRIVFYDIYSFIHCNVGVYSGKGSPQNVTWNSTLGWILGYRSAMEYVMSSSNIVDANPRITPATYYFDSSNNIAYPGTSYTLSSKVPNAANISVLIGDTAVNVYIYNYFMIILDDYNLNHLNDGLITSITKDMDISLPSYANVTNQRCNPLDGTASLSTSGLTQNQVYSATQIINQQKTKIQSSATGPFLQDVFALVPIKVTGLAFGSQYIEFGGTLQLQERIYFGPVNIRRMTVKLVNDKGEIVDLNNQDWSFALLCEQLYNPNPQKK